MIHGISSPLAGFHIYPRSFGHRLFFGERDAKQFMMWACWSSLKAWDRGIWARGKLWTLSLVLPQGFDRVLENQFNTYKRFIFFLHLSAVVTKQPIPSQRKFYM